jgi:hypothetical protein
MAELEIIHAEPTGDPEIIKRLDDVRAQVDKGEISSLAIVTVYRDGSVGSSWSKAPSFPLLMGGAQRLVHKLNVMLDE